MNALFESDIKVNRMSPVRKKYWVLWCIRQENCHSRGKKVFALIKKVLLCGTGCELPSIAFQGGGYAPSPSEWNRNQ